MWGIARYKYQCACGFVFAWYLSLVMVIVAQFPVWTPPWPWCGSTRAFHAALMEASVHICAQQFRNKLRSRTSPTLCHDNNATQNIYVGLCVESELTCEAPKCNLVTLSKGNVLWTSVLRVCMYVCMSWVKDTY